MGNEEGQRIIWKSIGANTCTIPTKKRVPEKPRKVPEYYFLPKRSIPSAVALYGTIIAAGVGAGMLVQVWSNKKIKEDGDVKSELDE